MSNRVMFAWNGDPQPPDVRTALSRLPWSARHQLSAGFARLASAFARSGRTDAGVSGLEEMAVASVDVLPAQVDQHQPKDAYAAERAEQ